METQTFFAFITVVATSAVATSNLSPWEVNWFEPFPGLSDAVFEPNHAAPSADFSVASNVMDDEAAGVVAKEFALACAQSRTCAHATSEHERVECIRMCMSPTCYHAVYGSKALELGEIDMNLAKFAVCCNKRFNSDGR